MKVEVTVPVQTVSESNRRDHWRQKHKRTSQQKNITTLLLRSSSGFDPAKMPPPYHVKLTRVSPGAIRDSDNLLSSTKAIRDAVAAFLGVDDADLLASRQVSWSVAQEKQAKYAVRIEISSDACAHELKPVICSDR